MHSVHSQNEGWEGMNVLAWVMDEASAFRTANGADNAENVYGTLRSSAQSRFGWMHWVGAIISFPRKQQGDFTLEKYEQSLKSDNIFGDRAATWEVHPRWEQGHPMYQPSSDQWVVIEDLNVRVPKEFEEDFLHDGVDALTKYMAQPPLTEGGFFENPHMITEAVNRDLSPLVASVGSRQEIIERYGHAGTSGRLPAPDVPDRPAGLPLKTVLEQIEILGDQIVQALGKENAKGRPAHVPGAPTHESLRQAAAATVPATAGKDASIAT